ncbi:DNA-binding protein [Ectopseudomonas oleovorans]|nr:DNA-binding protein [Pseudomonas indoloxydans]
MSVMVGAPSVNRGHGAELQEGWLRVTAGIRQDISSYCHRIPTAARGWSGGASKVYSSTFIVIRNYELTIKHIFQPGHQAPPASCARTAPSAFKLSRSTRRTSRPSSTAPTRRPSIPNRISFTIGFTPPFGWLRIDYSRENHNSQLLIRNSYKFICLFISLFVANIHLSQRRVDMRPAEFTPEQIIQAGQALIEAGRKVTGFALRQRVGGGNPNRLKAIWDEHLAGQSVVQSEPVAELPVEVAEQLKVVTEALTDRLAALAVDLNDKAVKASERRVAEVVRAAGEQREQADSELADASQTVDDLEQKLDEKVELIESLEQQLASEKSARQAQAVELAQVRERLVAVEEAAGKAADQAAQREKELQADILDARRAEQASREREAQAVGALAAAEKQHVEDAEISQRLRLDLRKTGDELAKSRSDAENATAQLQSALEELQTARAEARAGLEYKAQLEAATQRITSAEERERDARQAAEKASGEAHQAQVALQATQARLESITRELETAQAAASEAKAELKEIRAEMKKPAAKKGDV